VEPQLKSFYEERLQHLTQTLILDSKQSVPGVGHGGAHILRRLGDEVVLISVHRVSACNLPIAEIEGDADHCFQVHTVEPDSASGLDVHALGNDSPGVDRFDSGYFELGLVFLG
jgi:hypothetical protein